MRCGRLRGWDIRSGGFQGSRRSIRPARSLATDALARGFEEIMWIDSDTEFDPAAIERLRSHDLPIVSGLYPKKATRALASSLLPETQKITFGDGGGLLEIRYAATGFLLTKRQVYLDIQPQVNLPVCNLQFNKPLVPFFMTMVIETRRLDARGAKALVSL